MLDSMIGRGSKGRGSFGRLPWRKHLIILCGNSHIYWAHSVHLVTFTAHNVWMFSLTAGSFVRSDIGLLSGPWLRHITALAACLRLAKREGNTSPSKLVQRVKRSFFMRFFSTI